jgi:hypothetical protein
MDYVLSGNSVEHIASLSSADPSGARANHGDRVIAEALCWKLLKEPRTASAFEPKNAEPPAGSLAERRLLAAREATDMNAW